MSFSCRVTQKQHLGSIQVELLPRSKWGIHCLSRHQFNKSLRDRRHFVKSSHSKWDIVGHPLRHAVSQAVSFRLAVLGQIAAQPFTPGTPYAIDAICAINPAHSPRLYVHHQLGAFTKALCTPSTRRIHHRPNHRPSTLHIHQGRYKPQTLYTQFQATIQYIHHFKPPYNIYTQSHQQLYMPSPP